MTKQKKRVTHLKRGVVGQLLGDWADMGVVELGGKLEGRKLEEHTYWVESVES